MGALLGAPPYPTILMEFEPPLQRGAGFDQQHVIDLLRAHGYRAFCTTATSTGQAARRPSASGDALSDMMLPGSAFVAPKEASSGSVRTGARANRTRTWRLGTALVPQPGQPDCIDAVFIHERRLVPARPGRGGRRAARVAAAAGAAS